MTLLVNLGNHGILEYGNRAIPPSLEAACRSRLRIAFDIETRAISTRPPCRPWRLPRAVGTPWGPAMPEWNDWLSYSTIKIAKVVLPAIVPVLTG